MTQFRFFMIGPPQVLLLDVDVVAIADLDDLMSRSRFLCGTIARCDGCGLRSEARLQISRIQAVFEVCEGCEAL